jgi:hypothetical protein
MDADSIREGRRAKALGLAGFRFVSFGTRIQTCLPGWRCSVPLAEARSNPGAERNKQRAERPSGCGSRQVRAPLPAFVGVLNKYVTVIANCSTKLTPMPSKGARRNPDKTRDAAQPIENRTSPKIGHNPGKILNMIGRRTTLKYADRRHCSVNSAAIFYL